MVGGVGGYPDEHEEVQSGSENESVASLEEEEEEEEEEEPQSPQFQEKGKRDKDDSPTDPDASSSNFAGLTEGLVTLNINNKTDEEEAFFDDEILTNAINQAILDNDETLIKTLLGDTKSKLKYYVKMYQRLKKEAVSIEKARKKAIREMTKKAQKEEDKAEKALEREKDITININTGTETKALTVKGSFTVSQLKASIHNFLFAGLSKKAFKSVQLSYINDTLTDHPRRTLKSYKVKDGDVIRVVFGG